MAEHPCHFFSLPRELRDQIYRYCIPPSTLSPTYIPLVKLHVALLRTCKQIHEEASSILYGENTFVIRVNVTAAIEPDMGPMDLKYGLGAGPRRFIATYKENEPIAHCSSEWVGALLFQGRIWPAPRYHDLLKHLRICVAMTCQRFSSGSAALFGRRALTSPEEALLKLTSGLHGFLEHGKVTLFFLTDPALSWPNKGDNWQVPNGLEQTLRIFGPLKICQKIQVGGYIHQAIREFLTNSVFMQGGN